jgi:hypothetical protein
MRRKKGRNPDGHDSNILSLYISEILSPVDRLYNMAPFAMSEMSATQPPPRPMTRMTVYVKMGSINKYLLAINIGCTLFDN